MARRTRKKSKKRPVARAKRAKTRSAKRSAKRPTRKTARKAASKKVTTKKVARKQSKAPATLRTPPSSLDLNRTASAARSGRQAMADNQRRHAKFAAITGGDVDVDLESAYFSGDEGPGGDNPSPDQNDVGELGHAVGIEYADNQELKGGAEVAERDKHRWDNE
jgi:Family of unknown function (DUF6335)